MTSYYMGVLLGGAIGGMVPIWFLSWLTSKGMKKVPAHPRIVYSGLVAYVIAIVIGGFGYADGGSWNPGSSWVSYLISLMLVIALRTAALQRKVKTEREDLADG